MTLPAATFGEGILGLEAWHTFRGLRLNDLTGVFPRYRLDDLPGFYSKAESDNNNELAQGFMGEVPLNSYKRGKTFTYNGRIQAYSLPSLRAAERAMRSTFSDDNSISPIDIAPPTGRGGVSWMVNVRVLTCDIDEEVITSLNHVIPFQLKFSISVRMMDPRVYSGAVQSFTGLDDGEAVSCVNDGFALAAPLIKVFAPITSPLTVERTSAPAVKLRLEHEKVEDAVTALTFGFGPLPGIQDGTGAFFQQYLTFDSSWWDDGNSGLVPGNNIIKATGCDHWEISYRHADY
jgi:hypothetical protein